MNNSPIGVFDSGLGGISVLRRLHELMPEENYIYYGDSANAPYGVKTDEAAYDCSVAVFRKLLSMGCKAVVVACNTATSVAVRKLRGMYPDVPIVGIEPAIKPACEDHQGGRIVVMATQVTLRRPKFAELMERYRGSAEIIPVPCPGLIEFVEQDRMEGPELAGYLKERLSVLEGRPADAVVLGCTHYPFMFRQIQAAAGGSADMYDGAFGVARETRRRMAEADLLCDEGRGPGTIDIFNSADESQVRLSWKLFREADLPEEVTLK